MSPGCLSFVSLLGLIAAADPPPRLDWSGDPLPPRAVARLGSTRLRHGGWITAIAYSLDGKLLASASYEDNQVVVWEMPSGRRLHRFNAGGTESYFLAFSRDGNRLASSAGSWGRDKVLRAWDVHTGKQLLDVSDGLQAAYPNALAFSPDGKRLAAIQGARAVHVWELSTGRVASKHERLTGIVRALGWPAQDRLLALAVDGKDVCLWDAQAGKKLQTFATRRDWFSALAIAPDGGAVAFENPENVVSVRDASTGKERHRLAGHTKSIYYLTFDDDGRTLVSGSWDASVRLWDLGRGKELVKLDTTPGGLPVVALSPDRKALATGGANHPHGVLFWDAGTGRPLDPFPGHASPVSSIAVAPDGRLAATSSWVRGDPVVRLWEVGTGRLVREFQAPNGGVFSVAFSPDGRWLASCSPSDALVRLWDARTGKQHRAFRGHRAGARLLTFSPDGTRLASSECPGAGDQRVLVWDTATGKLVHELGGHRGVIEAITFTPNGQIVLVAGGGVRFWDVATGRPRGQPLMPSRFIWSVAISPDGKVLATADNDGVVRLWEFETRREILQLPSSVGGYRVAFAPNGRLLAIGAQGAVRLFDWSRREARPGVEGHRGQVICSVFSADGARLLSAGNWETWATVWDVAPETGRPIAARAKVERADLQRWWEALESDDPAAGYRAVWELVARPGQAVPLLKNSLRPTPAADARQVARLLKTLEDKRFAERNRARRELEQLGEAAAGGLREALAGSPSLEQRRRIEELLEKLEAVPATAEQLRGLRAVFVLEQIGSREARDVLEKLANGGAGTVLTRDARAALQRLARRQIAP